VQRSDHSHFVHKVAAANTQKIAEVDKSRQGVFLFNYFYADDVSCVGIYSGLVYGKDWT